MILILFFWQKLLTFQHFRVKTYFYIFSFFCFRQGLAVFLKLNLKSLVVQSDLKLMATFLPFPPKCGDDRHALYTQLISLYLTCSLHFIGKKTGDLSRPTLWYRLPVQCFFPWSGIKAFKHVLLPLLTVSSLFASYGTNIFQVSRLKT